MNAAFSYLHWGLVGGWRPAGTQFLVIARSLIRSGESQSRTPQRAMVGSRPQGVRQQFISIACQANPIYVGKPQHCAWALRGHSGGSAVACKGRSTCRCRKCHAVPRVGALSLHDAVPRRRLRCHLCPMLLEVEAWNVLYSLLHLE